MSHLTTIKNKVTNNISEKISDWKNQTIVFTNGCFDLLHKGHIEYLAQTADFGDKLIVAVNTDYSVKKLNKGDSRPIQDENSRALIIAALEFVDAVVLFGEDTPYNLINQIKPNVLVKGGDYDPNCTDKADKKYIVGSDIVTNNGGKVEVIQFVEGYSTSSIEAKIKDA
jgi:D-glycero-beta-D-manno-heptose 1-phosphate adenylyltransferase